MRIKTIELQNFQSWKRGKISLLDFNIIVGQSSAGKSSVLRALLWLLYGEWDATYPNNPEEATAVAVELENGTRIIRMRKGNTNNAAIIRGSDVVKFKSFGDNIPGIFNLMNVKPVDIGAKEVNLNFQLQDDPIFMVAESKPTKAQWLGRLYGAHVVNSILKNMSKDKRSLDSRRRDSEERLAKLKENIVQYSNISDHEQALLDCKKNIDQLIGLQKLHDMRESLALEKISIDKDAWVKSVNMTEVKQDMAMLSALKSLQQKRDALKLDRRFIVDNKHAAKADWGKLRDDIALLDSLKNMSAKLGKAISESKSLLDKRVILVSKLEQDRATLNSGLFSDNKCPVCRTSIPSGLENTLAHNIKHLLKK